MSARLILATASRTRISMFRSAGVVAEPDPADIDERAIRDRLAGVGAAPDQIAREIARAKALRVSPRHNGALVLGADQILVHRGEVLSKAADLAAAADQLRRLRGDRHHLLSAAALVRDDAVLWEHTGEARLQMRAFSDGFLGRYLAETGDLVLDSVGCYHLEGLGAQLFDCVEGDHFTVLGLPLLAVLDRLRIEGVLDT